MSELDIALDAAMDAAKRWRDQDPDDATRAELDALIAEAGSALVERFSGRLEFGTAGLRGELGAGPLRMNRVLVSQAAAGLAAYLLSVGDRPSVVIGYDGRKNSAVFAVDTAEILAGAGVRAILLPRLLPTPVLAFAVRHLDVSAGVMVTASHNPAKDNGYKVYLGDLDHGSQIVPPADGLIAARIEEVAAGDIRSLPRSIDYEIAGEDVLDAYVAATAALGDRIVSPPRFVYTAMHGVGWETARRVFADAGLGEPLVVREQIEPDAAFPTVAFPNPEEPGALDLALALAAAEGADLLIANDPDADRLAVAIPTSTGWRRLSGNEVGLVLGWQAALTTRDGTFATSIVSSPGLREIARSYGVDYVDTLTGFKWISRVGGLVYGFEEALGYLVDPAKVRDKDGISAAVVFLRLAASLKAEGKTVADHLEQLDARFGAYVSTQISLRVSDVAPIMARLRAELPSHVGTVRVESIDDFADGFGSFPPSNILRFWLSGGARVIVRPSGTEPKLKVYIDASSTDGAATERRATAESIVVELERGMRELLD